jgi:hypothetical protein
MESIVAREVSREVADQWGKECAEIADKDWQKRYGAYPNPIMPPWKVRIPRAIATIFEMKMMEETGQLAEIADAKETLPKCGETADMVLAGMC